MPVPIMEISSTGLRPYLSDNRPRMGEKINCIIEYEAKSKPTVRGVALKIVDDNAETDEIDKDSREYDDQR